MFIVLLTYTAPLTEVDLHVKAHTEWVDARYAEGVFVASGPLIPRTGGAILAHGLSRDALVTLLASDPFVINNVIKTEILEVAVRATDERLAFLKS